MGARVVAAVTVLLAGHASAFLTGSAFGDACHERITYDALDRLEYAFDTSGGDAVLEARLAGWFEALVGATDAPRGPAQSGRVLTSFLVGVRYPDLEGWGPRDLYQLREIALLPGNQAAHFLRTGDDRGTPGTAGAAAAGRASIVALLEASRQALLEGPQVESRPIWLEPYGTVTAPVLRSAFFVGQALHALQDAFSHTYRTDDLHRVNVVMTYVGAFKDNFVEDDDGPRHSTELDRCNDPGVGPIRDAATRASRQLLEATARYWQSGDRTEIDAVLDEWLTVQPGCDRANDYCAAPLLPLGRVAETGLGSCAQSGGAPWLAVALAWARRRRVRAAP